MVLITDEPYIYSENRYGIISMQDLANALKKDKIYTSVVCYNSHSNGYSPIYDTTQGIQIDLSLNWPHFLGTVHKNIHQRYENIYNCNSK